MTGGTLPDGWSIEPLAELDVAPEGADDDCDGTDE